MYTLRNSFNIFAQLIIETLSFVLLTNETQRANNTDSNIDLLMIKLGGSNTSNAFNFRMLLGGLKTGHFEGLAPLVPRWGTKTSCKTALGSHKTTTTTSLPLLTNAKSSKQFIDNLSFRNHIVAAIAQVHVPAVVNASNAHATVPVQVKSYRLY